MEEWLDDNKHLLGTIGMVILVVQVGGVKNTLFVFPCLSCLCVLLLVAYIFRPPPHTQGELVPWLRESYYNIEWINFCLIALVYIIDVLWSLDLR